MNETKKNILANLVEVLPKISPKTEQYLLGLGEGLILSLSHKEKEKEEKENERVKSV